MFTQVNRVLFLFHPRHLSVAWKCFFILQEGMFESFIFVMMPTLILLFFRQLLIDCGIGVNSSSGSNDVATEPVVSQHRVLLFCQLKSMLDIVENDLLKWVLYQNSCYKEIIQKNLFQLAVAADKNDYVFTFCSLSLNMKLCITYSCELCWRCDFSISLQYFRIFRNKTRLKHKF